LAVAHVTVVFENLSNTIYIRTMRRWLRFFVIFFAYGIALLHTAVPHHHEETADQGVSISRAACHFAHAGGGLLQLVFSTDLGYGHLELFKKGPETKIEFWTAPTSALAVFSESVFLRTTVRDCPSFSDGFIEKLRKRLLLFSTTQFRAPPRFA
jgi:hypothetical protein